MKTTTISLLLLAFSPALASAADERTCTMRDAAMPAPSMTYVLCEQGLLLVTGDEGVKWTTRKIADTKGLRRSRFMDVNRGLAAGDAGVIRATTDGGKTWTPRKTGTTENLTDLQMMGDQGWAVGL